MMQVSIYGRLTRGTFTTRESETREQYTLVADALLSARTPRPKTGGGARERNASSAGQAPEPPELDDDIPF